MKWGLTMANVVNFGDYKNKVEEQQEMSENLQRVISMSEAHEIFFTVTTTVYAYIERVFENPSASIAPTTKTSYLYEGDEYALLKTLMDLGTYWNFSLDYDEIPIQEEGKMMALYPTVYSIIQLVESKIS